MKRNKIFIGMISCGLFLAGACGDDKKSTENTSATTTESESADKENTDPKGVGTHQNVTLTHPLDAAMVTKGKGIADVKCASCHKTTEEKLVGPGWKGVTDRRTPEWIMNFVTNTEEMIAKDSVAKDMLEVCLVKMPNQGLTDTDARSVLEFMRKNDGKN